MTDRTKPAFAAAACAAALLTMNPAAGNAEDIANETYAVVAATGAGAAAEGAARPEAGPLQEATALAAEADTVAAHDATDATALRAPEALAAKAQPILDLPDKSIATRRSAVEDATALKLGRSLHETPRSVTVIDADRIREQNFSTLASTFAYVPGVFANSQSTGGYHYYTRGQRQVADDTRVDGFAGLPAGGDFSPDLFGIERAVMLHGPASLLYGSSGGPGGLINLISKVPHATAARSVDLGFGPYGGSQVGSGSQASYHLNADLTGPVTADGKVLYRALAKLEEEQHFTANVKDRGRNLGLALTYNLDDDGAYSITSRVQMSDKRSPYGRGAVISPYSSLALNDGSTAVDFDRASPLDVNLFGGERRDQTFLAGVDFRGRISPAWRLNAGYRYLSYDTDVNQFAPNTATLVKANASDERSWTVQRRQTRSVLERFNHGFDINSSYEIAPAAAWKTLFQGGLNGRVTGQDRNAAAIAGPNQSAINIYTGASTSALRDSNLTLTEAAVNTNFLWNVYGQNQTSLLHDRFVLTLGIGYMQENYDRDYSRTNIKADTVKGLETILATRYGEPTLNAAAMWNATSALALYTAYATSYSLPAGEFENRNGEGGVFEPITGVNYEIGSKYDLAGGKVSTTVALFWTEQTNVMVQSAANDLNGRGHRWYAQLDGEGRIGRGVELSTELRPLANLKLIAGGAYVNSENRVKADKVADGSSSDKTPAWSANAFTRYDVASGPLRGLGFSLGLVYQGERLSALKTTAAPDPIVMPWFTRLDAGLYYVLNANLDLAINVENLGDDRQIMVGGSTGANMELASPRRVAVRTSYRM